MIWGGFPGGLLLPVKCLLDVLAHGLIIGQHNRGRSLLEAPISQCLAVALSLVFGVAKRNSQVLGQFAPVVQAPDECQRLGAV